MAFSLALGEVLTAKSLWAMWAWAIVFRDFFSNLWQYPDRQEIGDGVTVAQPISAPLRVPEVNRLLSKPRILVQG